MPGVFNLSVDEAVKEAREVHSLGVPSVILFGLPDKKDEVATGAWADDGIVQQAARAIKREVPGLILMGDVCLCEYMSHGHCGIVKAYTSPQSLGAAAGTRCSARGAVVVKSEEKEKAIDELAAIVARAVESNFEIDNDASARTAGAHFGLARARRHRHHRSLRHDGRPRRRHSPRARRGRLYQHADSFLRREVRFGILRTVPRSRRLGAAIRRPPLLSDGWSQRARSHARNRSSTSKKAPT